MKLLSIWMILTTMAFSDIKVMISKDNTLMNITKKELSDLYLGKITSIQGMEVTPIDNQESYKEFYNKIIQKTPKQLRAYWMRETYESGKRQPPQKLSIQEIKKMMKSDRVIISYSSVCLNGGTLLTVQ